MYTKLLEIISVDFDVTDKLLIKFLAFITLEKNETVHQLFIQVDFRKTYYYLGGKHCTILTLSSTYPWNY
jgi:hypothetical protein